MCFRPELGYSQRDIYIYVLSGYSELQHAVMWIRIQFVNMIIKLISKHFLKVKGKTLNFLV